MSQFFEQIRASTLAWIFLALIAIASFAFSIYSHFSNNRKKELSVFISSFEIIKYGTSPIPGLELKYQGRLFDNLTISKFILWNSGNKGIDKSDRFHAKT